MKKHNGFTKDKYWDVQELVKNGNENYTDFEGFFSDTDLSRAMDLVNRHTADHVEPEIHDFIKDMVFHMILQNLNVVSFDELEEDWWIATVIAYSEMVESMIGCRYWMKTNLKWNG